MTQGDAKIVTSTKIFCSRDQFKMFGVNARPISAEMVDFESAWNIAHERGIGEAVAAHLDAVDLNRGVPVLPGAASQIPNMRPSSQEQLRSAECMG
ncbi:hypothetical protein [Krasilnikovia sp. M28-CT-15]|uniref:hypothetical protein n=1 Tax=Krasilnikovia sp. M28-CT-15 TaxID=3373540 RepID=UPI00399CAC4B